MDISNCPHRDCKAQIVLPDPAWNAAAPWNCSTCGGLYGIGKDGPFPIPTDFKPLSPLYGYDIARNFAFYSRDLSYVYALCFSSGLPFYIGKGTGKRPVTHLWEAGFVSEKSEKHEIILEHKKLQQPIWYHFFALTEDHGQAFDTEAYLIRKYGIRGLGGMLTNTSFPKAKGPPLPAYGVVLDEDVPDFIVEGRGVRFVSHPRYKVSEPTNRPKSIWLFCCPACRKGCKFDDKTKRELVVCSWCGHLIDRASFVPVDEPLIQFNSIIDEMMRDQSEKLNAARP